MTNCIMAEEKHVISKEMYNQRRKRDVEKDWAKEWTEVRR